MTGAERLKFCCQKQLGCITKRDIDDIVKDQATADVVLLVRCLKDRFLAPARMVKHCIEIIETDPDDRVRDVSVLAKDVGRWGGHLGC